jgi:hypothetical protein
LRRLFAPLSSCLHRGPMPVVPSITSLGRQRDAALEGGRCSKRLDLVKRSVGQTGPHPPWLTTLSVVCIRSWDSVLGVLTAALHSAQDFYLFWLGYCTPMYEGRGPIYPSIVDLWTTDGIAPESMQ